MIEFWNSHIHTPSATNGNFTHKTSSVTCFSLSTFISIGARYGMQKQIYGILFHTKFYLNWCITLFLWSHKLQILLMFELGVPTLSRHQLGVNLAR